MCVFICIYISYMNKHMYLCSVYIYTHMYTVYIYIYTYTYIYIHIYYVHMYIYIYVRVKKTRRLKPLPSRTRSPPLSTPPTIFQNPLAGAGQGSPDIVPLGRRSKSSQQLSHQDEDKTFQSETAGVFNLAAMQFLPEPTRTCLAHGVPNKLTEPFESL